VSPRELPRRTPVCWLPPREGEAPPGDIRWFCLVGKPSKVSSCSRSESISLVEECSSCLGVLHRVGSLPIPTHQDKHLARLLLASEVRSALLQPLRSCYRTSTIQSPNKLFSCNVLPLGVRSTALTKGSSERNMTPNVRRSRCVASAQIATGWVPAPLTKSGED